MSKRHEPVAAAEVLKYFIEHPKAADTLEGLAQWRLVGRGKRPTQEQVAGALAWLVSRGYLKQFSKPYADRIYSLDENNLAEAGNFLGQHDELGD